MIEYKEYDQKELVGSCICVHCQSVVDFKKIRRTFLNEIIRCPECLRIGLFYSRTQDGLPIYREEGPLHWGELVKNGLAVHSWTPDDLRNIADDWEFRLKQSSSDSERVAKYRRVPLDLEETHKLATRNVGLLQIYEDFEWLCFHCRTEPFSAMEFDEKEGVTADGTLLCPKCGIDAVIPCHPDLMGIISGENDTQSSRELSSFMDKMEAHYFKKDERVNDWPQTLDDCLTCLDGVLNEENKDSLRRTKRSDLIAWHTSLGRWIRNNFGLWERNFPLLSDIAEKAFPAGMDDTHAIVWPAEEEVKTIHPDNASSWITFYFWEYLREKQPFDESLEKEFSVDVFYLGRRR